MDIKIELKGQVLVAELCGMADALKGEPGSVLKVLRRIDELVGSVRPSRVQIDFRSLTAMESGAFRQIAGEVAWLSRRVPVELVGPGPAMERFFALQAPPPWWRWEEVQAPEGGEVIGAGARDAVQAFEIDLDREQLLRQNEPPGPAFNPMAEPLDLLSGPRGAGKDFAASGAEPIPAGPVGFVDEGPDPEVPAEDLFLPPDLGGDSLGLGSPEVEEEVELLEVDRLAVDTAEGDPAGPVAIEQDRRPAGVEPAVPPPLIHSLAGDPISPRQREEFLKARLVASLLSEDALRGQIAELEARLLVLSRTLEREQERAGQSRAVPASASGPARAPARAPAPAPAPGADRRLQPPSIPWYLQGEFPRGSLVAAAARLLETRSGRNEVPEGAVRELASRLAAAVERSPFAGFDFSQARAGAPPAARLVSVTATALCILRSSGASRERLRRLALAALLQSLSPDAADPCRLLGEEGPSGVLAGRLARRLSLLLRRAGESGTVDEEVLGSLQLLELASSFWRRIGPPPEGGAEPAAAAAALAREEIGREVPAHFRRLFLRAFSVFPPGSWVRLESGETGVVVAPGTKDLRGPLVLSLLSGGDRELRARAPRLVDTGVEPGARIRAVVACPLPVCLAPREILRIGTGVASGQGHQSKKYPSW